MGTKWVMVPFLWLGRDDVGVGVEEDGGKSRVGSGPLDNDDRFSGHELDRLGW